MEIATLVYPGLTVPRRWMLAAATVLVLATIGGGAVLRIGLARPSEQHLELPPDAIALDSEKGARLFEGAARADHARLSQSFQTQEKGAWCGVASSVTVLNARGASLTQDGLFTPEASEVRGWWRTTFGGMPISALEGLVEAHGAQAQVHYAGEESLDAFRSALERNLATEGDYLIANYDRRVLHEVGGGHISPLSALSSNGAWVLMLDTASYKYGPHWVPVDQLFDAMNTPDSESGHTRGWVEIR